MSEQTKITPTPWHWFEGNNVDTTKPHMKFLVGADGQGLAHTVGLQEPNDTANADYIVQAVNRHHQLVEALEGFISAMENYGDWDEGCFYYSKTAAPELEQPIQAARKALSQAQQP